MYTCIYIYIERERDIDIHIYIYIYTKGYVDSYLVRGKLFHPYFPPKVRTTRFSTTRHNNVLNIACFKQPGEVRVGVEYLSSISAVSSYCELRKARGLRWANAEAPNYSWATRGVGWYTQFGSQ